MVSSIALAGSMVNGNEATWGTRNSDDDEVIAVTVRVQWPALAIVSGSSRNVFTQTLPNDPSSGIASASRGGGQLPVSRMVRGLLGSLLTIVIVAVAAPRVVGWKRMGTSTLSPAPSVNGRREHGGHEELGRAGRKRGDGERAGPG